MFAAHIRDDVIQSCEDHSRNTAKYCAEKLKNIGLYSCGYLCGLVHDTGKYTAEFDSYIHRAASGESVVKGSVIHTFSGVRLLLEKYHSKFNGSLETDYTRDTVAEFLAIAVGSHHGLFDCFDEHGFSGLIHRMEKQPDYDRIAIRNFYEFCATEKELDELFQKASEELLQLLTKICETQKQSDEIRFCWSLLERLILSSLIDADRRDTYEFMGNTVKGTEYDSASVWNQCLDSYNEYIQRFDSLTDLNKKRKEFSDICAAAGNSSMYDGLCSLDIFTGGGKTLSGLRFALNKAQSGNKDRIIFVSPLLSITDQNAKVIREALGKDDYILEHHGNVVLEEEDSDELHRYELLTEDWNVPVVVTTLVQLLNTMFDGRTSCIRRFNALCNSIIVFDEAQSVPTNMLSLFNTAIDFMSTCCNITVVLCSATLPRFDKVEHSFSCVPEPIISEETKRAEAAIFKRNDIIFGGYYSLSEIAEFSKSKAEENESLLIICNKKDEAGYLYDELSKVYDCCYHLSSAMCPKHRKDVLKEIEKQLKSGRKTVCVSTQVIEAGIDISFRSVIRLLAGLDNVVQAAGRCNRNFEIPGKTSVYMVACQDENLSHLDDIKRRKDAALSLVNRFENQPDSFDSDYASSKSIDYFYSSFIDGLPKGFCDYSCKNTSVYQLLSNNRAFAEDQAEPELQIRAAFKTAGGIFEVFDSNQESVVVPYAEGLDVVAELCKCRAAEDLSYMKKLIAKAKNYSVSVFDYQLQKLIEKKAVYKSSDGSVWILRPEYYDRKKGLVAEEKEVDLCDIQIL